MNTSLKKLLDQEIKNGRLALGANLLYEAVFVGWITFAGLYALEALLPTFVTARLSLVKLAILLLVLSSLLIWLGEYLERVPSASKRGLSRPLMVFTLILALGIITLTHYRFPWWSIPMCVGGYSLTTYLFWKLSQSK